MVVKCLLRRIALGLVLSPIVCFAAASHSSYDPAAGLQRKPRDGFVKGTLNRINPANTDYGSEIEEGRRIAIESSIRSASFWTSLVAISGLFFAFAVVLYQTRERERREIVAARFLAQYHNAWAEARARVSELTRQYNALVEAHNRVQESVPQSQSPSEQTAQSPAARDIVGESKPAFGRKGMNKGRNNEAATAGEQSAPKNSNEGKAERPSASSQVDLIAQLNSLQQQLGASRERERNLQLQLNKNQRLLETEQQRNLSLKGH